MTQRQLLLFSLYTFIIIIAWVGFNLYNSSVTSTISEQQNIQVTPIDPVFSDKIIEKLKTREDISPLYQLSNQIQTTLPSLETPGATVEGGISP